MEVLADKKLADVFQSLLGIITWSVDLMNFIIDELYSLADTVKDRWGDKDYVEQTGAPFHSCLCPRTSN